MAANRQAVVTEIRRSLETTFININKGLMLTEAKPQVQTKNPFLLRSIEDLENEYLPNSDNYKAIKSFFDNCNNGIGDLWIYTCNDVSLAQLTSQAITLTDFTSLTDGEFKITLDGTETELKALDFTSATTIADIASVIEAKVTTATLKLNVTAEDNKIKFKATDETVTTISIDAISGGSGTDIHTFLNGGVSSNKFVDMVKALETLQHTAIDGFNFAIVLLDKTLSTSHQIKETLEFTTAIFNKNFHVFVDTKDLGVKNGTTNNIVERNKKFFDNLSGDDKLKIGNLSFFYSSHAEEYLSFGMAGKILSQNIGTQTIKFMRPIGTTATELTQAELATILSYNCNVYTGTNEQVGRAFVKEATSLKNGDYIDTSLGSIWIKTQLQNNIYNLLETTKVPINRDGFLMLETTVNPIFTQAINNQIINADVRKQLNFNGAEVTVNNGYFVNFERGQLDREIVGNYIYFDGEAAHFVTNHVEITLNKDN